MSWRQLFPWKDSWKRMVKKGRRGEVTFAKLQHQEQIYGEKRKKETKQTPKAAERSTTKQPASIQYRAPQAFYNQSTAQARPPARPSNFRGQASRPPPVKKDGYLAPEEYNKLTPEKRRLTSTLRWMETPIWWTPGQRYQWPAKTSLQNDTSEFSWQVE